MEELMHQRISKRVWQSLLIAICTALAVMSVTAKPTVRPEPDYSALDAVIAAELKDKHTPGAVVAVISNDKVVYAKAFGLANVETNTPMEKDMLFRIGSTTKMFTAAALVRLSESGKIKLNEPIGNKVKGLSPRLSQVTPHFLLSNSAGVNDF